MPEDASATGLSIGSPTCTSAASTALRFHAAARASAIRPPRPFGRFSDWPPQSCLSPAPSCGGTVCCGPAWPAIGILTLQQFQHHELLEFSLRRQIHAQPNSLVLENCSIA